MNLKGVVVLFLLFHVCVYSQTLEEKYVNSLKTKMDILKSQNDELRSEIYIINRTIENSEVTKLKDSLNPRLKELQNKLDDNLIELYYTRSKLPSSDPSAIEPIPADVLNNNELAALTLEINILEGLDKSGGLSKKEKKQLEKLNEELPIKQFENKRKILEAYQRNDKEEDEILPYRNLDHLIKADREKILKDQSIVKGKLSEYMLINDSKNAFKNSKITYRATIVNTNFTIPLVRFNTIKDASDKDGNIELFNSIGAGVSYSAGRITDIRDANGELVDSKFNNSWGFSVGCLFSSGSVEGQTKNVFAPMVSLNILDFQLGYGWELGTRQPEQRRGFITIAYAIPMYKLVRSNFRILKKGKLINDVVEN